MVATRRHVAPGTVASPIPSSNCGVGLPLEIIRPECTKRMRFAEFAIDWPQGWETEDFSPRVRTNRNEEESAGDQPRFETKR